MSEREQMNMSQDTAHSHNLYFSFVGYGERERSDRDIDKARDT